MYVHIDIHSLHAFPWLSITRVFMVPFLQPSNTRHPCLFLCLACRAPAHLPAFSPWLVHSVMPISPLCHLEAPFTCLQLPEADFLREISFKYYNYPSAISLQSLTWQTCLATHRTSLNSSLARPTDLRKVLKKCSWWASSNLTLV